MIFKDVDVIRVSGDMPSYSELSRGSTFITSIPMQDDGVFRPYSAGDGTFWARLQSRDGHIQFGLDDQRNSQIPTAPQCADRGRYTTMLWEWWCDKMKKYRYSPYYPGGYSIELGTVLSQPEWNVFENRIRFIGYDDERLDKREVAFLSGENDGITYCVTCNVRNLSISDRVDRQLHDALVYRSSLNGYNDVWSQGGFFAIGVVGGGRLTDNARGTILQLRNRARYVINGKNLFFPEFITSLLQTVDVYVPDYVPVNPNMARHFSDLGVIGLSEHALILLKKREPAEVELQRCRTSLEELEVLVRHGVLKKVTWGQFVKNYNGEFVTM
jgi:hypothetical protein